MRPSVGKEGEKLYPTEKFEEPVWVYALVIGQEPCA